MSLGSRLLLIVCAALLAVTLAPPAGAAEPVPTLLEIEAGRGKAGAEAPVTVRLTDQAGLPVVGAQVRLERRSGEPIGTLTTDGEGVAQAEVVVARTKADNRVVAAYDGDAEHAAATAETRIELVRRRTTLQLKAPRALIDGRRATLRIRWRAGDGTPVSGPVRVFRGTKGTKWKRVRTVRTGDDGRARLRVRPRQDTRWQVRTRKLAWVRGDRSPVRRIDNRPPGEPVVLPKGAPAPRRTLPPQRRAVGKGANARVTRIPDKVWRHMTGRSWHAGCPVGRAQLRLIRVNYWDFSGYRRRGEVVANADAAHAMAGALAEMYRKRLPIRAMYRVDRFGWSKRLGGADDYASMAADNTSAFNCRSVVGRPGVRSPHSYGRSLDVNPWENPYRSAQGVVPNRWWPSRSHPRVAWRSHSHAVVRVMSGHGLRWTYGHNDLHHFDYIPRGARLAPDACERYCT